MMKILSNLLKASPVLAAVILSSGSALAIEANQKMTNVSDLSRNSNRISQVSSMSQLSDVSPKDWAYGAMQSLVERYGCISGFPDGTFRGNRTLTRFEFAAALNACLDRINELIATATSDGMKPQDFATIQRLQEEFSAELATLRGRVDALEARTAELESNQFSTTTKLSGEAIFGLSQVFGEEKADNTPNKGEELPSNTTFGNRVRLTLNSSLSGTDRLQIRLNSGNITGNNTVTGTNMARLGFDGESSLGIDKVNYRFNLRDNVRVQIDAIGAELDSLVDTELNPDLASSGSGALSRYGRFSPIYRTGSGSGLSVQFNPKGALTFNAAYTAANANNPTDKNGVFDGDSTILGQLTFKPSKALNVGLTYARSYQNDNNTTTTSRDSVSLLGGTGSTSANSPFTVGNQTPPTSADNYGIQASFRPSSKLTLSGWAGYTDAKSALETDNRDAQIFYWAANATVKDFGAEGNMLGLIVGQAPKVTGGSGGITEEPNTSYHVEALYKMNLTDNITVTPGVIAIFNPEHNENNDTIYVGTLRTTFKF